MLFLLSLSSPSPPLILSPPLSEQQEFLVYSPSVPLPLCPSDPMFCSSSYFSPPLLSFLTSHCPLALFHCNISKHLPLKNCTFDPTWFFISYLIAYLFFIPKLIEGAVYNYCLETLFCDCLLQLAHFGFCSLLATATALTKLPGDKISETVVYPHSSWIVSSVCCSWPDSSLNFCLLLLFMALSC